MKTFEIKKRDWRAVVDLSNGASCTSLKNRKYGATILREPPADKAARGSLLYGMPILFPVNRIEKGSFEFEGRQYVFPINEPKTDCHLHGELYKAEFELIEASDSRLKCRYAASKDSPYLCFPHEFEIITEYELKDDGLYHKVTVRNLSGENMPVFLGFHTTFNSLFFKNSKPENIRVYAEISEEYARNMTTNYLPSGEKPPFDSLSSSISKGDLNPFCEKFSRLYRGCGVMTVTDTASGLRIVYENDEKYKFRLILCGGDDGYICLEPQTCLVNCQNSPFSREEAGFDYLKPLERKIYRSKIFLDETV